MSELISDRQEFVQKPAAPARVLLQRAALAPGPHTAPPSVRHLLAAPGQPLEAATRALLAPHFGVDLSRVRVHTGPQASESARAVQALAYTVGRHVVFGDGQYNPHSADGRRLVAHELAHVAQQRAAGDSLPTEIAVGPAGGFYEQEADRVAGQLGVPGEAPLSNRLAAPLTLQRLPDPNQTPANLQALFNLGSGGLDEMLAVMRAVETIQPKGDGTYTTQFRGVSLSMNEVQRSDLLQKTKNAIRESIGKARRDADYARSGYEIQKKINEEHYIVSAVVLTFAGVRGKVPELLSSADQGEDNAKKAESALQDNHFVEAAQRLAESEKYARNARRLWREYHEGIISAGETTITVLEYTRDASFITLGVLAIIATGGAAAGGAGAVTTTTTFGFEVGTASAANVIATGAPIVASLGEAGAKLAVGDKVDWAKLGVDIVVNLVLAKFGGKLSQGIFLKIVGGNPAVRSLGEVAFARIISSLATHELATAFTTAVDGSYKALSGQSITWEQFINDLVNRLTDPKGLFIAGLMGAVHAGAEAKFGGAKGVKLVDSKGAPVGDVDEVRGGVIYEDKSATGLNKINPKTGLPYPGSTPADFANKQVYDKTKNFINNMQTNAVATAPQEKIVEDPRQAAGSRSYPSLDELKGVRKLVYRIEADSPALRTEVEGALNRLRAEFKDWSFSAEYGVKR